MNIERHPFAFAGGLKLLAALLLVPALQGCMFLVAPEPDAPPAKPKKPPEWIFDPADGPVDGNVLNTPDGTGATPHYFVVGADGVYAGDIVAIRSKKTSPAGVVALGPTADTVHLAGIITPRRGEQGFEDSRQATLGWLRGKDLTVVQDKVFPTDTEGRRLVAIKFKASPEGDYKDQDFILNRMMVRNGYALVDLYSPTSFDTREWLKDEAFARRFERGLWKQPQVFRVLQQRVPLPKTGKNKGNVQVNAAAAPAPVAPAALAAPAAPATP